MSLCIVLLLWALWCLDGLVFVKWFLGELCFWISWIFRSTWEGRDGGGRLLMLDPNLLDFLFHISDILRSFQRLLFFRRLQLQILHSDADGFLAWLFFLQLLNKWSSMVGLFLCTISIYPKRSGEFLSFNIFFLFRRLINDDFESFSERNGDAHESAIGISYELEQVVVSRAG